MSMRVERSSLDQVKKRFEVNKKKMEEKQKEYDFEERMKELREEVRGTSQGKIDDSTNSRAVTFSSCLKHHIDSSLFHYWQKTK